MNPLRNRSLERRLRQMVRAEVRRSPSFKKAKARQGVRRNHSAILWLFIPTLISLGWLIPFRNLQPALAVLTLMVTVVAFLLPRLWLKYFFETTEIFFLSRLPVANRLLFEYAVRRFLRASVPALLLCGIWASFIFFRYDGGWEKAWGVLLWLVLQGGVFMAFVLMLVAPESPMKAIPSAVWQAAREMAWGLVRIGCGHLFWFALAGLWVGNSLYTRLSPETLERIYRWLGQANEWLSLLLPWGWPTGMVFQGLVHGKWEAIGWLIPLAGWMYLGLKSYWHVRQHYDGPWQGDDPLLASPIAQETESHASTAAATPLTMHQPSDSYHWSSKNFHPFPSPAGGLTALTDYIVHRKFLRHYSWEWAGWVEKVVFRRMSPRLELVAQMLLLSPPKWSHGWRNAWIAVAAGWAITGLLPQFWGLIVILAALYIATQAWPVLGGQWPALAPVVNYPHASTFMAYYPVSIREISRAMLLTTLLRLFLLLPLWPLFLGVTAWLLQYPVGQGVIMGLKIGFWGLAIQPLVWVFKLAPTCGDDRRFPRLFKVAMALGTLWMGLLSVLFLVPLLPWEAAVVVYFFLLGFSWLCFWWYRRRFEKMKFDWMASLPPTAIIET